MSLLNRVIHNLSHLTQCYVKRIINFISLKPTNEYKMETSEDSKESLEQKVNKQLIYEKNVNIPND